MTSITRPANEMQSTIINNVTMPTVINNVEYALQSRTLKELDGSIQHQYRVLLEGHVIKDWSAGNIEQYFNI